MNKLFTKGGIMVLFLLAISSGVFAQVSGTVFQDFNGNGTKDNTAQFNEVGLAGVVVNATDPAGGALTVSYTGGGSSTNATGGYSVTGGTLGQIRLEFVLPDAYTYASTGAVGGTTVMFPTTATQNLAVNYAQDYSQTNPKVTVPCYINGDSQVSGGSAAAGDAIVTFDYDTNNKAVIGLMEQVGAVWGTAYHRQSDKLFYAALAKRHVSWGPLGPNGIYVTTSAKTATGTSNTGSFVDLKAINPAFDAGNPTRDFTPGGGDKTQANYDSDMVLGAGTTGLGDLDVSDDGQYLYTAGFVHKKIFIQNRSRRDQTFSDRQCGSKCKFLCSHSSFCKAKGRKRRGRIIFSIIFFYTTIPPPCDGRSEVFIVSKIFMNIPCIYNLVKLTDNHFGHLHKTHFSHPTFQI